MAASTFKSIPFAKNRAVVAVGAGDGLDVLHEPAVAAGRGLAHVVVLDRRSVRLELSLEHRSIALQAMPHRRRRSRGGRLRRTSGGGPSERIQRTARHASFTAMKSSFFEPNRRKRYGCEIPARRAIASVDAPCSPRSANSTFAASRTATRRVAACLSVSSPLVE